jgi:hypothetical protein
MIDPKKDYLVILRKDGKYSGFQWYSRYLYVTEKGVREAVEKFNSVESKKSSIGVMELITDPLVKEICAYTETLESHQNIIDNANAVLSCVDEALDTLQSVSSDLHRIRRRL